MPKDERHHDQPTEITTSPLHLPYEQQAEGSRWPLRIASILSPEHGPDGPTGAAKTIAGNEVRAPARIEKSFMTEKVCTRNSCCEYECR